MRFVVAALVALFVFAPAAQAQVTFTDLPDNPSKTFTFNVGFSAPGAVRYDCVHVFPDQTSAELLDCKSPFEFREAENGRHVLRVTASDADGGKTEGSQEIVVAVEPPPPPTIDGAMVDGSTATLNGTTAAATTVAVFEGTRKLGDATVAGTTWTLVAANLTDGTHSLTAVAYDAAENASPASTPRDVAIDTGPPAKPTIDVPVRDAVNQRPVTLGGTTQPGTTLVVTDGVAELGRPVPDGGTWALTVDLADGVHAIKVEATDGNGDKSNVSRSITIDTVAPQLTISDVPSLTNVPAVDIAFNASEPVVFDCVHVFPDGGEEPSPPGCASPFGMRDLVDGPHTVRVTATDPAGNAQTKSVSFTIDTQAPAAVEPVQTGTSEFTFAGEAGATFECSVDGAAFSFCTSPQQLSGLASGEHTFAVLAVDAAGNRSEATTRTFAITAPPAATPVATVVATPAPVVPPVVAPTAELGRTLVARTVSGKVYVRRPATASLLDLGTVAGIPVGTEIDARKGRVRLTAAARPGRAAHRAEFFGGVFIVTQAADDIVDLRLSEPFGSCARKAGTRLRKLWGDGTGRFRTRGLNSIATVRGTRWLVQDSCEGTLTRVSQGVVSVRDTAKRKTFLVRAGRKYLAVPKTRK